MDILRKKERYVGWLFSAPFTLSLLVFFVFAFVRTIIFSVQDYNLFNDANWVGAANFITLVKDPLFALALQHTLVFAVVVTSIQTGLALMLALAANKKVAGQGAFRTIFYLPSIMSSAAMTLIFIWLFQKQGVVNQAIAWVGNNRDALLVFALAWLVVQTLLVVNGRRTYSWIRMADPFYLTLSLLTALVVAFVFRSFQPISPEAAQLADVTWLSTRERFGPLPRTLWAIVALNTFTTVPTLMLLYLAGLQSVSHSLYEAATLEGASEWQKLRYVTWPRLMPVTFMVVTLGLIGTLQMFDQVALLGNSAPLESKITLAYYTYYNAFPPGATPRIGLASAGALMLAALTLTLVLLQRLLGLKERGNDN